MNLGNNFPHNSYEPKKFIIDGSYLYLTMGPRAEIGLTELHIFNISISSQILHISSVLLGESNAIPNTLQNAHWDLDKRNNLIYVASRFTNPKSHIKIVDVNNPGLPLLISNWHSAEIDNCGDIEIKGDNIFLTDMKSSFNILTIINDTTLSLCKKLNGFVPEYYNVNFYLKLWDQHAFIYNVDCYAVFSFDISNPCNATLIDTIALGHDWYDISTNDNSFLYSSVWNFYQFYCLDTRNLYDPKIISRKEIQGRGLGIDVKENYAYIAMGSQNAQPPIESGGLFIYDISNPHYPVKVGWSPPNDSPPNYDVQVFVNPQTKLAYVITGEPNGENESYVFNVSDNPGLRIIDVSNPNSPVQLSILNINQQCRGIHQKDNYAYIAASDPDYRPRTDTSGLYIIDISNSSKPFIVGKFIRTDLINGHSRAVVVKDNYAYLAHGCGFLVVDITNPSLPTLTSEILLDTTQAMDIAFEKNFLFVLTQQSLYVYNISNPKEPLILDSISGLFFQPARRFHVQPPYIYVVSLVGIYIFQYIPLTDVIEENNLPSGFNLEQNYPNPFNPSTYINYKIQVASYVTLKIYDILGKEIATLVNEYQQPGKYEVKFDASYSGQNLGMPSGVYFYKINAGDFTQTRKMILMK